MSAPLGSIPPKGVIPQATFDADGKASLEKEKSIDERSTQIAHTALSKSVGSFSKSILSYRWQQVKLFFSSLRCNILKFFSEIISKNTSSDFKDLQTAISPSLKDSSSSINSEAEYFDAEDHPHFGAIEADSTKIPSASLDVTPTEKTSQKSSVRYFSKLLPIITRNKKVRKSGIPLGIQNFGNSCYLNASNQALFACKPFLDALKKPITRELTETDIDFSIRESIQTALINLSVSLAAKSSDINDHAQELREVLFTSEIGEFVLSNFYRQLDAAQYLELILGTVLNYQPMIEITRSGMKEGRELKRAMPQVAIPLLQIPLLQNEAGQSEISLQKLVDAVFTVTTQDSRDLPWEYDDDTRFSSYQERTRLVNEPQDVLVFQLKRGVRNPYAGRGAGINHTEVQIPEREILDFSLAHGLPKGGLKYRIQSFIRLHAASGNFGHYTSYAKVNDQWYHFNDSSVTSVSEKTALREMGKAYFIVLQKVEASTA